MQSKLFNRYFILIWCSNLCLMIIQNLMCSGIPLFLDSRGFSTSFAGLLGIPFAVFGILSRTAGGYLMDRFSRRIVMVLGPLVMGTAALLFRLLPVAPLMLLFRGLHGTGFSMGQAGSSTATVDVTPKEKSSLGVGIFWVATALAIAGAGWLIQVLGGSGVYDSIFYVSFGFGLLGALLALLCNYESRQAPVRRDIQSEAQPRGLRKFLDPAAARPAVIEFFVMLGVCCCNIFAFSYAVGQEYENPSAFMVIAALAMMASNLASDGLIRALGHRNLLVITMAASGALIALMALIPSQGTFYLGAVGFGMAQGFSFPILTLLAVDNVPQDHRGTANSTMLMAGDVGVGLGTFLWGVVIQFLGYYSAFALSGLALILSAVLGLAFYRKQRTA